MTYQIYLTICIAKRKSNGLKQAPWRRPAIDWLLRLVIRPATGVKNGEAPICRN
jgi:hypothetical protein